MNARVSKWVVVIPVFLAAILPVRQKVLASKVQGKNINPVIEAQILHASVQIRMFAPTEVGGQFVMSQGLATLVINNREMLIVTHNHWGEIMKNAEFVRFYDASDLQLVEMNGEAFKQLILEQDAGTLLIKAPKELKTRKQMLRLTSLGSVNQVREGDRVLLVHQAHGESDKLALMEAVVEGITTYKMRPAFRLYTLDGQPIIPGDSGGGVWLNGQLVGNIWGRETVQPREELGLTGRLTQAPVVKELGYVAKLPETVDREGGF